MMGRKAFDFSPEKVAMVQEMAGLGLTDERMSGVLGIALTTFQTYKRKMPEIKEAIRKGKGEASFKVGRSLFNEATAGVVPAIKWWEQTRDDRAERSEITGKDGEPIGTVSREPMTNAQWEAEHGKQSEE